MSETSLKEDIKIVNDYVKTEITKHGYSACWEWCIDLSDTLIIVPRNSWSMDVIAVRVTSGTVQGTYVPVSWSAPKGMLQSEAGRCLYFNSPTNEWLFSQLSTHDTAAGHNNNNNNNNHNDNSNKANNNNNNSNNNSTDNSNSNSYHSSPASTCDTNNTTIPTKNTANGLDQATTAAALEAMISLNYSADFDYEDSDSGSGSGNTRKNEGKEWENESAKYSAPSVASSMFHSFDALDGRDGVLSAKNMSGNDNVSNDVSVGERGVTRVGNGKGEGEGREGNEVDITLKGNSESSRSQRSRLSSTDADDMFFDTFEDLPSSPTRSSPFPLNSFLSPPPFTTSNALGDELKDIKKVAAVRFSIPASADNSASVTPRLEAVALALSAVSRIVITLRHTDVFVSLAGPLTDQTQDEEKEVFDETRLFSNVSHRSAVFYSNNNEKNNDEVGAKEKKLNYDKIIKEKGLEKGYNKPYINIFETNNATSGYNKGKGSRGSRGNDVESSGKEEDGDEVDIQRWCKSII